MSIKLQLPKLVDIKPRLTVFGVGGAGCNAVNNMIAAGLEGVDFVAANTDAQSLATSSAEHRIQLGALLTEGLGAGSKPEIGEAAAEEAIEEIRAHVAGAHMVFIAAGMGGGTGTGAAGVIARTARQLGILTVGIVTKPFQFEGARRSRTADAGIAMMRDSVDTLIVIPNQNLFRIANERTTFAEAFVLADQVLYSGVACIVDLVLKEGLINLDFADVRTVMSGMGTAMMGTGEASGPRRAFLAAEEAIANPLLDDISLKGAKGLLLSITGGRDLTLYEVDEAIGRVRQEVDPDANIIFGATFDDNLDDRVRVSIVAAGIMGSKARAADDEIAQAQLLHAAPSPESVSAQSPGAQYQSGSPAPHGMPAVQPNAIEQRIADALQTPRPAADRANAMPPHVPDGRSARETWQAPGNVRIDGGLSGFGGFDSPVAQRAPGQLAMQPPGSTSNTFEPQPPVEPRRAPRRIPDVADFPPVGQREWHARNAQQPAPSPAHRVQSEPNRVGLFGRLAALGRKSEPEGAGQRAPSSNGPPDTRQSRSQIESLPPFSKARDRR